jgi:PAS domain S-box-containing protein
MPTTIQRHVKAWGLAVTSLALALLLTLTLAPLQAQRPYLLFFPAIMGCAWWGGLSLALAAIGLSAVAVHVWVLAPAPLWSVSAMEAFQMGAFMAVAAGMSWGLSALVAERMRFAVTLASIGDAVIVTDPQGRVTFLNAVAADLTGWTIEEATGRDLTEVFPIVHMHTRQAVDNPVTRVLRDGHVVGLANHTVLRAKDGTERPIDDSGAPLRTPAGEIVGVVLVFRDVTARRRAEDVRRRLAALVASSDDAIIGLSLAGIVTDWNPGAERLYGYPAAAMVGQSIARLIPPDLPDDLPTLLARLQRGDRIDHYETQRVAKDGTRLEVALTISPMRDAAGQLIGASKIARDITARKHADAELARRRQETALLAEVAQRLSASLDLETVLQRLVMGAQALCGSERAFLSLREPGTDALVGRYESGAPRTGYVGLRLAPGQGLGAHVLRTGQPWRTADYVADPRFSKVSVAGVRAGGHLAMLAVPIWVGGQVAGVLYVTNPTTQPFTDQDEAILVRLAAHAAIAMQNAQLYQQAQAELTERQQAQAALAQAAAALEQRVAERTAQLEAANRELEAFSYSVSHDLRAPLRAVHGFARILLDEHAPHLPEAAQRYLRLVVDSAQHMGQLIDDLLAFARLSRQPLTRQAVAPAALVRQVLQELRPAPDARRIDVRIGALPPCQADPALLKQVWVNLLANALKFTSRRDVAVIEVGGREEAGASVYWVRDNGVGFDMAYADKLFGVFQRLHRADEYDGTGVGLALVQRIIQRHGGRIWAEAAVEQGATFFFTLGGASAPP